MTMTDGGPQTGSADSAPTGGAPLGPDSLTWKYHGDLRGMLLLWRTGTLQNMHPAVHSALQEHSDFFTDPWDRLMRSQPPIMGVIYDQQSTETGGAVRGFHEKIKGEDDGHGKRYHALDPDVFWWTHATFVEMIIAFNEYFGKPLTMAEKDQLVAEGVTWWQRYGLSMRPVIYTYAEFETYWNRMLAEELERNATTDWAMSAAEHPMPAPPGVPGLAWKVLERPFVRANMWLGVGLLPPQARETLGVEWSGRDELVLRALGQCVRRTWPLLPARIRYHPRAYAGMRRVAADAA